MKLKPQTRQLEMQAQEISDNVIQLTFSSEAAVSRSFGNEILSHEITSVDLQRMNSKAPVLLNHNPEVQIGVVERSWIEDGKGKAEIRFSRNERAQEVKRDVLDGIMPNTSVGYRIYEAEEKKGGDFVVTRWSPFELSIVSIPADISVGYGRSDDADANEVDLKGNEPEPEEKTPEKEPEPTPEPEKEPEPETEPGSNDSDAETQRHMSIQTIAGMYDAKEDGANAIRSGMSVEDFQRSILEKISSNQEEEIEMKKPQTFSIVRALNALADGDWSRAEYEKEICDELRTENTKGISVPAWALRSSDAAATQMKVVQPTTGAELVDDQLLVGEFIDVLYNNSWLSTVGVRRMGGLVGDITIQKKSQKPTFGWLAEAANVDLTNFQIGTLKMSPKTMAGGIAASRKLMMQSTPSIEMLIRQAIIEGAAEAVENYLLNSTGADDSPKGIIPRIQAAQQTDAKNVIDRSFLVNAVAKIREKNVRGSLYVMMNAEMAGILMNIKTAGKDSGVPQFVMSASQLDCGELLPVIVTEHMPKGQILIGDFSQIIVGAWGNVDLVPDTSTLAASGGWVIRLWQDMDMQCRYDEAFHLIKNANPKIV